MVKLVQQLGAKGSKYNSESVAKYITGTLIVTEMGKKQVGQGPRQKVSMIITLKCIIFQWNWFFNTYGVSSIIHQQLHLLIRNRRWKFGFYK